MISYRPTFIPTKVMIIGCGGTGSRLVPMLGQFLKTCAWIPSPEITLIDDDVVEDKNLFRQNFIATDVGKPKAAVLAQRYSRAFNVTITPYQMRVKRFGSYPKPKEQEERETLRTLFKQHRTNSILIMCVDSPEARRDILHYAAQHMAGGQVLLLDSGNENDFGQITVSTMMVPSIRYSNSYADEVGKTMVGDMDLPFIPMDLRYFAEMTAISGGSCADLDQTMAINIAMATAMFGVIQNFYYAKPINFTRLNISLGNGSTPEYLSMAKLKALNEYGAYMKDDLYPAANIDNELETYYSRVHLPFAKADKKAKAQMAEAEAKVKAAEVAKIEAAAVERAKRFYGWSTPQETSQAGSGLANAIKALAVKTQGNNVDTPGDMLKVQAAIEAAKPKSKAKKIHPSYSLDGIDSLRNLEPVIRDIRTALREKEAASVRNRYFTLSDASSVPYFRDELEL